MVSFHPRSKLTNPRSETQEKNLFFLYIATFLDFLHVFLLKQLGDNMCKASSLAFATCYVTCFEQKVSKTCSYPRKIVMVMNHPMVESASKNIDN